MSEYLDNLVKCFSNSSIGVNLTTVLIDNEPWFIAKEVASALGYSDTAQAIRTNIDELNQKMLSYNECKELFVDMLGGSETVGSDGDLKVLQYSTLRNPISVSNRGMKLSVESEGDFRPVPCTGREPLIKINSQGMKLINEAGLYTPF